MLDVQYNICTAKWISYTYTYIQASQVVLVVKNLPANAE